MAAETFRLPESSYEELVKIINAYGTFSKEVGASDVGKAAAMNDTTVSKNNAFLVGIGVLQEGPAKRKALTDGGRELSRALGHEMPDEIRRHWRLIVTANDFLQKMLSAVRIRKGMERSSLQSHIAYSAGLPKNARTLTGSATVIDILRAAELIVDQGDKVVPVATEDETSDFPPEHQAGRTSHVTVQAPVPLVGAAGGAVSTSFGAFNVNVNIEVRINCGPEDVEGLGEQLRRLLERLTRTSDTRVDGATEG